MSNEICLLLGGSILFWIVWYIAFHKGERYGREQKEKEMGK